MPRSVPMRLAGWVSGCLGVLAVAAFPAATGDAGESTLVLLHDVRDDGYTYVGNPVQFGYMLLDAEGRPTVHHNGRISVTQNDVLLYETSLEAGHDYNVLNTMTVAFPAPGPYKVRGEVPLAGSVVKTAEFEGFVFPVENGTSAQIHVDRTASGLNSGGLVHAGNTVQYDVWIEDGQGNLLPHTDALVEVRRPDDFWLLFRTHLHSHNEKMQFRYTFTQPGTYLLRAVGYNAFPDPEAPPFAPVSETQAVEVAVTTVQGGQNAPEKLPDATGSTPYKFLTTFDPYDHNTPFSRTVLSVVVHDGTTGFAVPHVNFEALLQDALGRTLFHSRTLHEYDGHFELTTNQLLPGQYTLTVNAAQKGWIHQEELPFLVGTVLPPEIALANAAGGVVVTAQGLEGVQSGTPTAVKFSASTLAGTPAMHSEIDFQIARTLWGPPILQNKVHTHDSGTFEVTLTFPEAGDYVLLVDPLTIHGDPTPQYFFGELGGRLAVPLSVKPGPAFPYRLPVEPETVTPAAERVLPGPAAAMGLLTALGVAALLGRRG